MTSTPSRFSTEQLELSIALEDKRPANTVHPRQARELLRLDTEDRRTRAYAEACTQQNLLGGRLSDCLSRAVHALSESIANNTEMQELYGERAAREFRQTQVQAQLYLGHPRF